MASATLRADHWVSRGLQVNFADPEKRVAVIDASTGVVIAKRRPVKSNFRELGFTTFLDAAGELNDVLERAFASLERTVLNDVRRVGPSNRGPELKAAVANLFAIHLVRNPAFKDFHESVLQDFAMDGLAGIAGETELAQRFEAQFARRPVGDELTRLVAEQFEEMRRDPITLATSMIRQHDLVADKLNRFHMQVIEIADHLPGLALGDAPVIHAKPSSNKYGFRDRLALLDAEVIVGPVTRRTAACFSVRPLRPVVVRTRKLLDGINAVTLKGALREVACHPDDELALRHTYGRLDRIRMPFGHS